MTEFASLVISVDSRQVKVAGRELGKLESAGAATASGLAKLAAAAGAYLSTAKVLEYAEAWTTINNRLRLVTNSQQELAAAQDAVFTIAQGSRQPLTETAELYQRIATNADNLELSGGGVARVVESINKSLAISGTAGAGAQAALVQLGQAFASGTLRGDELNAVLEQAPALATAISKGMGVTVGELRALGAEGKLTGQAVAQAILQQSEAIDQNFARTSSTVSQAVTQMGNSMNRFVGQLNDATGASHSLADGISSFSQWLDQGYLLEEVIELFAIWSSTVGDVSDGVRGLQGDLTGLGDEGASVAGFLGQVFKEMPANITAVVKIAAVEVAHFIERLKEGLIVTGERLRELERIKHEQIDSIYAERDAQLAAGQVAVEAIRAQRQQNEHLRREREKQAAEAQRQAGEKLSKEREQARATVEAAAAAKARAAEAKREQNQLEQGYTGTLLSMREQIALYGDSSEAARINFAITSGSLMRLSAQKKASLMDEARKIDLLRQEVESTAYLAALQDKVAARKTQMQIGVAGIGMGDQARQEMEQMLSIQEEYAQRHEELARAQSGPNALPADVYNQRLQQMRSAMDQETQIVRDGQAAQLAARQEGFNGVTSAWSNYLASASDVAGQMDALFTNAFRNAEDALVEFVKTGELDLRKLADAVLTDVIRLLIRMGIQMAANAVMSKTMATAAAAGYVASISGQAGAQVAMAGLNTFASIAAIPVVGPAAAPGAAAAAMAAAAPMGLSAVAAASSSLAGMAHSGIDSVPREGTWLLDKGERVLSPRQNRDLTDFMGRSGGSSGPVTIINQTSGRIDKVEERTGSNGERILIIQEAVNAVAASMRDPNSSVSRSMQGGFNVQRRR